MLILTLTLVVTSCDVADLLEETAPHSVENQIDNSFEKSFEKSFDKSFDKLEDRIENEHRAVSQERNEPTEFLPQEFQPVDTHRGKEHPAWLT